VILFLFLTHLGLGIVFTLAFVSREAGVKFFRFNAGLAAILIAVSFVFYSNRDDRPLARLALQSLVVAEAAVILYWATIGRALARVRPLILGLGCAAGLVAIVAQAIAAASGRAAGDQGLTVASFLSSSGTGIS